MATATTSSTYIAVQGADNVGVEVATFAAYYANANNSLWVQVSETSTTSTFKRLAVMGVYSAASGVDEWNTLDGTGNVIYNLPQEVTGYKYARMEFNQATTASVAVNFHIM